MLEIEGSYNPSLVIASIIIAIAASHTALELVSRVATAKEKIAIGWLVGGSIAMGCGIWSMHFVGMLALNIDLPYEYDVTLTLLSLLVGILISFFAMVIGSRNRISIKRYLLRGLMLGFGISAMHYTGMEAFHIAGEIKYQPLLLTASVVIAILSAIAAQWISFNIITMKSKCQWRCKVVAAIAMGFAIVGMHYTAMAAVIYVPNDPSTISNTVILALEAGDNVWLALAVTLSTIMILGFTHLTLFFEYRLDIEKSVGKQLTERSEELQNQAEYLRKNKERLDRGVLERKMAENEAERLGKILDESFNEIYVFDVGTWHFIQVNRGARENNGYSMDELKHLTMIDMSPDIDLKKMQHLLNPLLQNKEERLVFESRLIRKDKSVYPVEIRIQMSTSSGDPVYVAIVEDISKRKTLQRQLIQSQKLESIGHLATGIAHEINTPTQFVGDNIQFLKESFDNIFSVIEKHIQELRTDQKNTSTDTTNYKEISTRIDDLEYLIEEIPTAVEQSMDGIERIKRIVGSMKEFSHPGNNKREAVDINHLIQTTITVALNEWKYVANVETDFDKNIGSVLCFPQELAQVVLNMLLNAVHTIESKVGSKNKKEGLINIKTRKGDHILEIHISDTGNGMSEDVLGNVFNPFFTTKNVGKGTGQGLAISHSTIVDKHGGSIDVHSEIRQGSTFIIKIPDREERMVA